MDRRQFLESGVGVLVTANSGQGSTTAAAESTSRSLNNPDHTLLRVLPVMTNIIHTGAWGKLWGWRWI